MVSSVECGFSRVNSNNRNIAPCRLMNSKHSKDIKLSKLLSWLLRHGAAQERLLISPEGYVDVEKLLQHKNFKGKYTKTDIERVVNSNDKQRFKLRVNPHTKAVEIKANQGHTISWITDTELTPILEPTYNTVVHGTYLKCWPQIKTSGLHRMQRQHIHLAKGTAQNETVISGLRGNVEIYIFIDLKKALENNIKFFESDNGVILTRGDEAGYLRPEYFLKVINVSTGW